MTPIAHEIAKDSCLPLANRRFGNAASDLGIFDDLHFFDVSAVLEMARGLQDDIQERSRWIGDMAFLAAPRMLVEWGYGGQRQGWIIEETPDADARCSLIGMRDGSLYRQSGCMFLPLRQHTDAGTRRYWHSEGFLADQADFRNDSVALIYAYLAMINTPRVINRTQHMPHAGLQRRLAAARGLVGKFPLRAWTELKLEVRPPQDASGEPSQAKWLTGEKCLHFSRAHLRIRLGRLEFVSSSWKGDPALGIKQTRYSLQLGRAA